MSDELKHLHEEIAKLRERVAVLEARPTYVPHVPYYTPHPQLPWWCVVPDAGFSTNKFTIGVGDL